MPAASHTFPHTGREASPRLSAAVPAWVMVVLVVSLSPSWCPSAAAQPRIAYGVAVTPRNFPDFTVEDMDTAFQIANRVGNYTVFIFDSRVPRRTAEHRMPV